MQRTSRMGEPEGSRAPDAVSPLGPAWTPERRSEEEPEAGPVPSSAGVKGGERWRTAPNSCSRRVSTWRKPGGGGRRGRGGGGASAGVSAGGGEAQKEGGLRIARGGGAPHLLKYTYNVLIY